MQSVRMENRIGWWISGVLHAILAVIFFFMLIDVRPFVLDFTELSFAPASDFESGGGAPLPTLEGGSPVIELPSRPMISETSPLLKLPDRNRPIADAVPPQERPKFTDSDLLKPGKRASLLPSGSGTKERPSMSALPVDDELLTGTRPEASSDQLVSDEMFTISWDSGRLPTFPSDVKRTATVKISFTVAPDGTVIFATPHTKSDPRLEQVSIDALRSWRFNPLESSHKQQNQSGVITFVFKLK